MLGYFSALLCRSSIGVKAPPLVMYFHKIQVESIIYLILFIKYENFLFLTTGYIGLYFEKYLVVCSNSLDRSCIDMFHYPPRT